MVSNYDRILAEITKEAQQLAPEHGIDSEVLVTLAMEVVDLEDQHRIKSTNIKQRIEDKIFTTAVSQMSPQDS